MIEDAAVETGALEEPCALACMKAERFVDWLGFNSRAIRVRRATPHCGRKRIQPGRFRVGLPYGDGGRSRARFSWLWRESRASSSAHLRARAGTAVCGLWNAMSRRP